MSALAKQAREKMKAKAKSLATERDMKVDSSDWSPAEPLNADVKTGARPVGKARLYKKGGKVLGKVAGKAAAMRADRKPRKAGGRVEAEAKEYANAKINRDVRAANEEREGKKHIGGFKKGGAPKRATGGGIKDKQALGAIDPTPKRGAAQHYKKGGKAGKAEGGFLENIKNALMGKGYADGSTWEKPSEAVATDREDTITPAQYAKERAMARKNMSSPRKSRADKMTPSQYSREMAMAYENERPTMRGATATPVQSESFMKKGGKVKRADGGEVKPGLDETDARMSVVKPRLLTFGQNTVVPGQKKGGKVEKKGLPAKDNKKHGDVAKRMNRAAGGMVDIGAMKKPAKAKKGKTNINIVINAGKREQAPPMDMGAPPMPAGVPIPMPPPPAGAQGGMPPAMPPMGAAPPMMPPAPPAAPPAALPGAMGAMPRKRGGRVAKQIGGAMGFNPAQAGLMAGAAPSFRPANMPMAGARAPAPAPALQQQSLAPAVIPGAADALRFEAPAPTQRFTPGAPVNIAGPGIRPVQNLEINRAATTYPTKQLLTQEQMAMIPTQSISLQEALRLFLPPQQAAQQAANMSRQPMPQNMTPAETGAEQARRVQQVMAQEQARKQAEAQAAAERAAAERAAAERAAAERAAAERAAAARNPQPSGPTAAQVMQNYYLYKMMTSDRSMKTGVGRKAGGKVK
jgi:hypothetical protein